MMKLYVWHGVLCDYTAGIACVMAESEEAARASLSNATVINDDGKPANYVAENIAKDILDVPPIVLEAGQWAFCWGGG